MSFTAVIGPNGSGKSNLMDAVSFVFGVRAQHLRSNVLKNLIHGAGTSRAAKRASVKAVLQDAKSKKELKFMRSIKQDGACEYHIDDKLVSQEHYIERLEKLNILSRAKNFLVFQGDVERIAQKSPKELSQFMEEISGSIEYKAEFDACLQAKEKAEEEVRDNLQRRRGIKSERKQYLEQKEEADRFQKLVDQKERVNLDQYVFQLCQLKHQIEPKEADRIAARVKLQEGRKEMEQVHRQAKKKRKERAKVYKQYMLLEEQIHKKEAELKKLHPDRIKNEEQLEYAERKLATDKKQLLKAVQQKEKQAGTLAQLQRELADVVKRREVWEKAMEQQDTGRDVQLQKSQLKQYNSLKEKAARETSELQVEIGKAERAVAEARTALEREKEKEADLRKALETQQGRRSRWADRCQNVQEKIDSISIKLAECKKQQAERGEVDASETTQVEHLAKELDRLNNQLREAKADRLENERDRRMNETLERLHQLFPGCIKGRIVDLCTPVSRKYNVAVPIALGKNIDAVVVDTDSTAKSCISYFKEQKAGVATFIPLQSIQTKPTNERLRQLGGTKKLVIDVIQFDKGVQKAMEYACGSTVVCDTLDEAKRLCFSAGEERYKCVTLDGTLIARSGNMTGGHVGAESHAQRWEEKAVAGLKKQRDALQKEAHELNRQRLPRQQELTSLESQITMLAKELEYETMDLQSTQDRLAIIDRAIADLQDRLDALTGGDCEMQLRQREQRLEEYVKEKESIEDRSFANFCASVGIANIREYEGKELQAARERQRREVEFKNVETRLRSQVSYEESRSHNNDVAKWTKAVNEDEQLVARTEEQKNALAQQVKAIQAEIAAVVDRQKNSKAGLEELDSGLREAKQDEYQHAKALTETEKAFNSLETQLDSLWAQRHALLRTCRMDEVKLPLLQGSLDDLDSELGSQSSIMDSASMDTQDQAMAHQRETNVHVDFSSLSADLQEPLSADDVANITQQYTDRLKLLQSKIDAIAPNMKAMERLEVVRDRLRTVEEEFEAVRAQAQLTDKKFREVQKKRYEKFDNCYQHVAKAIEKIYKDLTKNPDPASMQPGGTAYLTLENQEEPYLYGVEYNTMPPAKRFRSMDQLSGGEKTVAALALLFAMQSYRPSPLFVLDEIDAALDAVNVARVANYIKDKSAMCQCVVISLKDSFFCQADGIVGVYRDPQDQGSHTLTYDLHRHDNVDR